MFCLSKSRQTPQTSSFTRILIELQPKRYLVFLVFVLIRHVYKHLIYLEYTSAVETCYVSTVVCAIAMQQEADSVNIFITV